MNENLEPLVDSDGSIRFVRTAYHSATGSGRAEPVFVFPFHEAVAFGGRMAEALRKAEPLAAEVERIARLRREADEAERRLASAPRISLASSNGEANGTSGEALNGEDRTEHPGAQG